MTLKKPLCRWGAGIAAFYGCALSAHAAQLDLMPDDYVVKPDQYQVTLNYLNRQQDGFYQNGSKLRGSIPQLRLVGGIPTLVQVPLADPEINANILTLRVSKFYEVAGLTVAPVALLSYRDIQNDSKQYDPVLNQQTLLGKGAQGLGGDIGLGGSVWLINDQANKEFLAVTAFLTLPTGDYDPKKNINLSEHRWRFVLGGGWVKPLGERWVSELNPEVAWYGDNDKYRDFTQPKYFLSTPALEGRETLSQQTSFGLTETLRYKLTPQFHLFGSVQLNRGGRVFVNNIAYSQPMENTRCALGALYYTQAGQQWLLRYAKDTNIENGLRNDGEWTVRYMHYF